VRRRSLGDADGQPVTRCLERLHGDQGAAFQLGFETGQDLSNHFNNLGGAQTLQSQTNYRWPLCPRDCQDCVKVRVKRQNCCVSSQRECKDLLIGGLAHPNLTHVHTVTV